MRLLILRLGVRVPPGTPLHMEIIMEIIMEFFMGIIIGMCLLGFTQYIFFPSVSKEKYEELVHKYNNLYTAFKYYEYKYTFNARSNYYKPNNSSVDWKITLGLQNISRPTKTQIDAAYKNLAKIRHPDKGGSVKLMAELNIARDKALKSL